MLRQGRAYPGKKTWGARHLRWLQEQSFAHAAQQFAPQAMLLAARRAGERLERIEAAVVEFLPGWSLAPVVEVLRALRGVSLVTAAVIMVEVGDLRRFDGPRKLMGYLGLVPGERSTGESVRRFCITEAGNGRVRRALVESAWSLKPARRPPPDGYISSKGACRRGSIARTCAPPVTFGKCGQHCNDNVTTARREESMIKALGVFGTLLVGMGFATGSALAQAFPTKQPVKIVVASNAGGGTDALARVTAEFLQRRLSQAVVVENRPGAAGVIGADYVAKSPADGYTVLLAGAEQAISPAVRPRLPYSFESFTFLIRPFTNDTLLVASPKFAPNTLKELIDYMKANPGKVRYGSTGVGAIVHLGMAMLESAAGVKAVQIPYTGIAPVYTDLLAGNIDITIGANHPFPDGLKVLANANSKRSALHPNAPTLEESGYREATWGVWYGFLAPPNLPQPVADRLTAEILAIVKDPEAIERYKASNKLVPDAAPLVGDDFKKQALAEAAAWKALATRLNIVVQQ